MASQRVKRKRSAGVTEPLKSIADDVYGNASEAERKHWGGWCEIESEPAFFNTMMQDMGVEGVKVQEVVSLDRDLLTLLPRPVFGLVFLFRWRESRDTQQENPAATDVWFANQTVDNACATVALLNIINNIPNLHMGEQLHHFRAFSKDLPPTLRGDALGNFDFVKQIHNSFARKMDILSGDFEMKTNVAASKKRRRKPEEAEAGLHFNAFVPIQERLWKLDGLEPSPICLGPVTEDWIESVKADLEARMATYEDGNVEFALLGLVRDPLEELTTRLANNVRNILWLQAHLSEIDRDWYNATTMQTGEVSDTTPDSLVAAILGPSVEYGLSRGAIDHAKITEDIDATVAKSQFQYLVTRRTALLKTQDDIRRSILQERNSKFLDEQKAASRRHDYGPAIQTWLRCLCRVGVVQNTLHIADTINL